MLSEIKLHRQSKHKNICELEKAFEDEENVYMLLELCSNGVTEFTIIEYV
jgi:serine/threonine protein kinase